MIWLDRVLRLYSPSSMIIIANPKAGHGRGRFLIERLPSLITTANLEAEIWVTQGPGDGTRLAQEALDKDCRRIVVMGGDGSVREVAQGVLGSSAELGLIPIGTGNDLARSLQLPINQPARALQIIRHWKVQEIDAGWDGQRCFLSVMGIGYPALVANEANRLQWLKGPPSFTVSVYKALRRMRQVEVRVELDERSFEVGCTSILIHNTPFTGGGLRMAPMAQIDDGLLDVVIVDLGRLGVMWNFPKIYRGTHLNHPRFKHFRSAAVSISSKEPVPTMQDGEVVGELPAHAEVIPRALRVVREP